MFKYIDTLSSRIESLETELVETEQLKSAVREFLGILDTKELSDSGRSFSPTHISSCRTAHVQRCFELLQKMKRLTKKEEPK